MWLTAIHVNIDRTYHNRINSTKIGEGQVITHSTGMKMCPKTVYAKHH